VAKCLSEPTAKAPLSSWLTALTAALELSCIMDPIDDGDENFLCLVYWFLYTGLIIIIM